MINRRISNRLIIIHLLNRIKGRIIRKLIITGIIRVNQVIQVNQVDKDRCKMVEEEQSK